VFLAAQVLTVGSPALAQTGHATSSKAKSTAKKSAKEKTVKKKAPSKSKGKGKNKGKKAPSAKAKAKQATGIEGVRAPRLPRREPVTLTARDREAFAEAMKAVYARAWSRAEDAIARTNSPVLKKIVQWAYIKEPGSHSSFAERTAFILNNPGWPGLREMQRRAEESLGDPVTVTVPAAVVAWFNERPPLTTIGKVAYARALKATGDPGKASELAKEVWATGDFDRGLERDFLDAFGSDITQQDHRRRLDNLLYAEDTVEAERLLPRMDAATVAAARARMGLITDAGNVATLLRNVPPEFANDPGLLYDRIKWRRRHKQMDAARELLAQLPATVPRTDLMWQEREALAIDALNNGLVSQAYNIANEHGELKSAADLADAEWLAGWIALRFLKDGTAALPHFEKVYDTVQYPANVARGAYWTGRTAAFLGRDDIATEWYEKAAVHITTFYGQLALARLKTDPMPTLSDDPVPTEDDRKEFESREVTQAMRALADIGDTTYLRSFIFAAADAADSAVDNVMAAEFADRLGHPEYGVALSRQAGRDKIVLLRHGYFLPTYPIPTTPEAALILAIARQESSFDPNARSPAGALGMMQLMPATARGVARSAGVKFVNTKLISDPAYNLRLGAYFLDRLVERFDGSYVLAAAAYNAGPSRVRQWIRDFGDPRDPHVDAIDWIERIPFSETRNYVQRIMENLMVYRARLAKTRVIGQTLEAELPRAKPAR
jgi:soluble lytic murein transglycosylase